MSHPTGADPLYDAQDFEITDFSVALESEFRGLIGETATFRNFGRPQRVGFSLRSDTRQEGASIRILGVSHEGWSFPSRGPPHGRMPLMRPGHR